MIPRALPQSYNEFEKRRQLFLVETSKLLYVFLKFVQPGQRKQKISLPIQNFNPAEANQIKFLVKIINYLIISKNEHSMI